MAFWKFHFNLDGSNLEDLNHWDWSSWLSWKAAPGFESWLTPDKLFETLQNPRARLSVWVNDHGRVGAFILWIDLFDEVEVWLLAKDSAVITESFSSLWTEWEKKLCEMKFPNSVDLWVEVAENNSKAIRFYEKVGFQKVTHRMAYYGGRQKALVYRKHLCAKIL